MAIFKIETSEHVINGTMVSQKVTKLFGLPIYVNYTETSNYNLVGQFDPRNFTNNQQEEQTKIPLYTETHIGFSNEENTKENVEKATEQSNSN